MDTTQTPDDSDKPGTRGEVDELIESLDAADPADAPPIAEEVAARLAEHLDTATGDRPVRGGGLA